jgi:hypothetical protein
MALYEVKDNKDGIWLVEAPSAAGAVRRVVNNSYQVRTILKPTEAMALQQKGVPFLTVEQGEDDELKLKAE